MVDLPRKRKRHFERHLREETAYLNGIPLTFYRRGRRWHWRVTGAKVKIAKRIDLEQKKRKNSD